MTRHATSSYPWKWPFTLQSLTYLSATGKRTHAAPRLATKIVSIVANGIAFAGGIKGLLYPQDGVLEVR